MTTSSHPTATTTSPTAGPTVGSPLRRALRSALAVVLAAVGALAGLVGLAPAAGAADTAILVDPVTDNYKARWNADPTVPELRTWLAVDAVQVGGVTFTPATVGATTTTVAAADGLALRGSDGSSAVLTAATTSTNVFHQGFFRVDPTGTFGLLQQLRTKVVAGSPVVETLTVSRNGVALGAVGASFTYDAAIATAPSTSIEFNGPGGRWFVGGAPTRLDWEPAVAPAQLVVDATAAAPTTPGSTVAHVFTVTNVGGAAGPAHSMMMLAQSAATPGARLVSVAASQGTCDSTGRCALGSLGAGASATVTVTVDVLRTNGYSVTVTAADEPDLIGDEATVTPTVTGASCTVIGTAANDTLVGTTGKDVLCGFAGNDTLRPAAGDDAVHGGAGTDTVSYSGQASGVVVNLGQSSAWDVGTAKSIGWDTFTGIESAIGTASADQLLGTATANTLNGGAGNDQIWGYDGNDSLVGGAGADKLYGGNGNDTFNGGTESDLCSQGTGTGTKTACETA